MGIKMVKTNSSIMIMKITHQNQIKSIANIKNVLII
jgi:hypothetical protein